MLVSGTIRHRKSRSARIIILSIAGFILLLTTFHFIDFKGFLKSYQYKRELNIFINNTRFRTGDLLFRRGSSFESLMVLMADRRGDFSHIGIVLVENDTTWVVHMEPGKDTSGSELIRKESVFSFLAPEKSTQYSLFRLKNKETVDFQKVEEYINQALAKGYEFDNKYDADDEDKLYCSELVSSAYQHGGLDLLEGKIDNLGVFSINISIILPSSLIRYKEFINIKD